MSKNEHFKIHQDGLHDLELLKQRLETHLQNIEDSSNQLLKDATDKLTGSLGIYDKPVREAVKKILASKKSAVTPINTLKKGLDKLYTLYKEIIEAERTGSTKINVTYNGKPTGVFYDAKVQSDYRVCDDKMKYHDKDEVNS